MARSPASQAREARRFRSVRKFAGQQHNDDATGHPALFVMTPALELDPMPEGGGYPVGFVQEAARLIGCPRADIGRILHVCSGSVRAPLTIDVRPTARPRVVADARWLPVRPASQRWVLIDPPYGPDYLEEIWQLDRRLYPSPAVLLREASTVLAPGGMVGLLHHVIPQLPDTLVRVGTYGVTTGAGYRIRALTIARRLDDATLEPDVPRVPRATPG